MRRPFFFITDETLNAFDTQHPQLDRTSSLRYCSFWMHIDGAYPRSNDVDCCRRCHRRACSKHRYAPVEPLEPPIWSRSKLFLRMKTSVGKSAAIKHFRLHRIHPKLNGRETRKGYFPGSSEHSTICANGFFRTILWVRIVTSTGSMTAAIPQQFAYSNLRNSFPLFLSLHHNRHRQRGLIEE